MKSLKKMSQYGRVLYEDEKEAWVEYEAALDTVPTCRNYDRVSVHNAFPHIQEAFDKVQQLSLEHREQRKKFKKMKEAMGIED